ncbi:MAG: ribosome biogenesis GTPase Der [Acidobacteria bacterium]|nr:ribosome biogenesis GTPase Der [Acidobacteriota bacterium]
MEGIVSQKTLARVVLVGRPNVGKSTLFNRLSGARRSIVTAIAGTTRDVITHPVTWGEARFDLTDTGGLFGASEDPLHELVVERGQRALKSADLIIFVVDGREGLIPGDQEIAAAARATGVPVILAINKMDDRRGRAGALELYQMGFDSVVEISAEHGQAVGDLLEVVVAILPQVKTRAIDTPDVSAYARDHSDEPDTPGALGESEPTETAIAIVGRPNAGKSSLVNRLLREERMIVSEMPGTTRDSVDSVLMWHRRQFRIVDTAGIRKPGKVSKSGQVETLSVMLAKRAIERADVVVLVIDATVGPTDQDGAIAGAAKDAGRGVIVAANKWDLMKEQGPEAAKVFDENLRYQLKFLDFAPILHISAVTGERTPKLLEVVDKVYAATRKRVPTGELNRFILKITGAAPPVTASRRNMRVMYAAQAAVAPPTFILFTNSLTKLHFSYERFLENRLREEYGFLGAPIRIQIRGRAEQRGGDVRKTGRERAPERRSPVRKGPGSSPSKHERLKAESKTAHKGAWDKSPSAFAKATADKSAHARGKAKGKPVSAKQKSRAAQPNLSKKSRAKQGPKRSGR